MRECTDDDDDDDDDFSLFQVRLLDNYKDRSPGLHMWTLPFLVPTTYFMVHHQNFRQEKEREKEKIPFWVQLHTFPVANPQLISEPAPLSTHICSNQTPHLVLA
mmetsp:Transcript_18730/g.32728  ORF Transcript_18730/g.32728 Transcript_18730/m.32728 type:complete len:104 (-) Transcript_18730:124-435(-)